MCFPLLVQFLDSYAIRNCRIGLAVSGGGDSTALFHMMRQLAPSRAIDLVVLHVNYHLRGSDSDEDQRFVESLCGSSSVPCFVRSVDLSSLSSGMEERARNERYHFFDEIRVQEDLAYIATAHTANDQAETLLFRLVRGTGLHGAMGILPCRNDGIIRPLLSLTREDVTDFLSKNNYPWREDLSNDDTSLSRNYIRHHIIPALKVLNPSAVTHLAAFSQRVAEDFSDTTDVSQMAPSFFLPRESTSSVLMTTCRTHGLSLTAKHLALLKHAAQRCGAMVLLPHAWQAEILREKIFFWCRNSYEFSLEERLLYGTETEVEIVSGLWGLAFDGEKPQRFPRVALTQYDFPLSVRALSEDDYLYGDIRRVSKWMKKAGLSQWERRHSFAVFNRRGELLFTPVRACIRENIVVQWWLSLVSY